MKKFAGLAMATVVFLCTFEYTEAQILQRFRSNIRDAISTPAVPQPQAQPFNAPRPERYQPPQVQLQRPAPQRTAVPQRLTPYSQVPPQQRMPVLQQQLAKEPRLKAPVPIATPTAQATSDAKVRVVTYYDPRTGRTFQRRYLIPGNTSTGGTRATQGQVNTGRKSIFTHPTPAYNPVATTPSSVPVPAARPQTRQSLVPPIQFTPRTTPAPANSSPALLPALAGPALAAPPSSSAQPIAASIDKSGDSSRVETASVDIETTPTGIPDLSGITVEPAPLDPQDEADQQLFFDNDSTDEMVEAGEDAAVEELRYSVLEEFEEE